ncbi:MAG TPA: hypothetical protein VFH43_14795, partial [Candidatus Kapabacteria bacterium]|nr:hypothetical protein [Candidatus Kapabacteria bacterium]
SQKILWFGLNYQGSKLAQTHYFTLGPNLRDSVAPLLTETKISEPARRIRAEEDFPCQRGIRIFEDSALVNFAKISRIRNWPDMAYDSIVVIDPSQPASGYYIATDSSGNTNRIFISYTPANDIMPPVWSLPFRTTSDQFQLVATELRKGDKGLKSVALEPGAVNLRMDSVVYISHRIAHAYVARIDPSQEATGCIIAIDSAGNDSTACVEFNVGVKDFNPPVITQRALVSPYLTMVADVTELKTDDEGIESISVTPISNVGATNVTFISPFTAVATITIVDSFYLAEAIVTALDSAGNSSQLTVKYAPQPDTKAPVGTIVVDGPTSRSVTITEVQAWDRGLKSVVVAQSVNVTPTQTADARSLNSWSISLVDPFTAGSLRLDATDSAGNSTTIDVTIPPQNKPVLKPLTYTDPLDFGTVPAPYYLMQSITITNPNDEPTTLTSGSWAKDDSVFKLVDTYPIIIDPNSTRTLSFEYEPQLLGEWTAIHTFETTDGNKYPVVMVGRSVGLIHVEVSNESVPLSGDRGMLKLTLSGTPIVTNADTIKFDITLDEDVATLEVPTSDCSNSPWLCNYDLVWANVSDGYSITLARKSATRSLTLASQPTIEIPFTTYFADEPMTSVQITKTYGSRSSVTSTSGSITVGEACGEPFVRSLLRGESIARIIAVNYDPVEDIIELELGSQVGSTAVVQVVDINGVVKAERSAEMIAGSTKLSISATGLGSGHYHAVLRTESSSLTRAFTLVR